MSIRNAIKLPFQNDVEVSATFEAQVTPNIDGTYSVFCPPCETSHKVSCDYIKNAGLDVIRDSGSSAFQSAAYGAVYNHLLMKAKEIAEKKSADFIDYCIAVGQAIRFSQTHSDLATEAGTNLKLQCGRSVSVKFGESYEFPKLGDKINAFLSLGIKGEKSYRWMSYIYHDDGYVDAKLGQKKADEMYTYVNNLQEQKQAIEDTSNKMIESLSGLHLNSSGFKEHVQTEIRMEKDKELKSLTQAQFSALNPIEEALFRAIITHHKP